MVLTGLDIQRGQLLGKCHYVSEVLGEGSYGVVVKCLNWETREFEAIKVFKSRFHFIQNAKKEIAVMKRLQCLDAITSTIVRCNDFFFHQENICLNFELLDQSLLNYQKARDRNVLLMTEIRPVIHQTATALEHLRSVGIIHADVKPENIMVVDRNQHPLKVKLIDFGLAHPQSEARQDRCVQTRWYRAPEVILGIPYSAAIDVWSLGLVAAEMLVGFPLYCGTTVFEMLRFIKDAQGQPPDHHLDRGCRTEFFFNRKGSGPHRWTLKTPEEFNHEEDDTLVRLGSLDSLEHLEVLDGEDYWERRLLVDLIKRMMHLDPDQRITPQEILQHPFIANSPHSSHANNTGEAINTDAQRRTGVSQSSWFPQSKVSYSPTDNNDKDTIGACHKLVDFLGIGGFGCVTKCININTGKMEAIKRFQRQTKVINYARKEIDILKQLQCLDPDTCCIVKWNGFFFHQEDICLNFELLDQSLLDYQKDRERGILLMTEIRPVIHQMATALEHLWSVGIIHADVKPENIMIVDRNQHPLQVKLIDFGLAHLSSKIDFRYHVQTIYYRAPEIMLEMPHDEAIDVWSLGLVTAGMAIGEHLYPGDTEYEMLNFIIQVQGLPPNHLLDKGRATDIYFKKCDNGQGRKFKTPFQYELTVRGKATRRKHWFTCLNDLLSSMAADGGHMMDQLLLLDLIKQMMHLDPDQRITPQEILQHPFMTASHGPDTSEPIISSDDDGAEVSQQASRERTAASAETPEDAQRESEVDKECGLKSSIIRATGTFCGFLHWISCPYCNT